MLDAATLARLDAEAAAYWAEADAFVGDPPGPDYWSGPPPRTARERARYRRLALERARVGFAAPRAVRAAVRREARPAARAAGRREPAAVGGADDSAPAPAPDGPAPAYLTPDEAADYLRLSRHTLAQWRSRGGGPAYCKLGTCVRYLRSDLDAWALERRCGR